MNVTNVNANGRDQSKLFPFQCQCRAQTSSLKLNSVDCHFTRCQQGHIFTFPVLLFIVEFGQNLKYFIYRRSLVVWIFLFLSSLCLAQDEGFSNSVKKKLNIDLKFFSKFIREWFWFRLWLWEWKRLWQWKWKWRREWGGGEYSRCGGGGGDGGGGRWSEW